MGRQKRSFYFLIGLGCLLTSCLPVAVTLSGEGIISVLVENSEAIYGAKLVIADAQCLDSEPSCNQLGNDAVFGLGSLEANSRIVVEVMTDKKLKDVDCGLTAFSSPDGNLTSIRNVPCDYVR